MNSTSRKKIEEQLNRWQTGDLSVKELHAWAESLIDSEEYESFVDDWDANDDSVSMEVLRLLEMADVNLLITEDIPLLKKLLTLDGVVEVTEHADAYFKEVEYDGRRDELKGSGFYVTSHQAKPGSGETAH